MTTGDAPAQGTVVDFDGERGLGIVEAGDGERLRFHCTQIADGTRAIATGARVRFRRVPGLLGVWEAAAVERLDLPRP